MTFAQRLYVELRAGRIERPAACEACADVAVVVAHPDEDADRAADPLDHLVWLCRRCDRIAHGGEVNGERSMGRPLPRPVRTRRTVGG